MTISTIATTTIMIEFFKNKWRCKNYPVDLPTYLQLRYIHYSILNILKKDCSGSRNESMKLAFELIDLEYIIRSRLFKERGKVFIYKYLRTYCNLFSELAYNLIRKYNEKYANIFKRRLKNLEIISKFIFGDDNTEYQVTDKETHETLIE
ncbi:MAG: hypothetical protein MHPSP_003974 [Paramarteilia canceri]